jgi:hypothetical protein
MKALRERERLDVLDDDGLAPNFTSFKRGQLQPTQHKLAAVTDLAQLAEEGKRDSETSDNDLPDRIADHSLVEVELGQGSEHADFKGERGELVAPDAQLRQILKADKFRGKEHVRRLFSSDSLVSDVSLHTALGSVFIW